MSAATQMDLMKEIKRRAGGLLVPKVYSAIYDVGKESSGGTFVEIGTAHGAATIALALGAKQQSAPFHIYTVDPFCGAYSSRTAYGSVDQNVEIVRTNFNEFGVDENITVVPGLSSDLLRQFDPANISVLLIDADGRIDRDLDLLYDRLTPACQIILDDVDGNVKISRRQGSLILDQKHRLTRLLVRRFLKLDILREPQMVGCTGFFSKGEADTLPMAEIALSCYRELVFAEIDGLKADPKIKSWLKSNFPGVIDRLKRLELH
jgi:predicted O-methyltransferase YrrM